MMPQRFLLLAALLVAVSADEAKILSKTHGHDHAAIEAELRQDNNNVESFVCTLTGASGQPQCDAAKDDDGSGCVWCVLNSFGFCVSETQAQTFKQAIPMVDCDDDDSTDDKAPPSNDDDKAPGPLWECMESKDEAACGSNSCVWCDTKGKFGVCLTKEAADMAKDSYWFDCKTNDDDDEEDADAVADYEEAGDEEEDYEDEDAEYEDEDDMEDEDDEDDMHEFVVDTSCVLSGMLLDPDDDEASSEAACFQARDIAGSPCEWCAVAGSPFRLCLSEPQAQVAEYVGAVCTGSDDSFEPEEFDDSCIAHMQNDRGLTRQGCWKNMDLDGNGCEWCNLMGVELCLGGVQAELVEHWGATCVMDDAEHKMAQDAIQQHREYLQAQKEAERIDRAAEATPEAEEEDELDLTTLWLTPDPSCMVTTLRTSNGDDSELACAQTQDAKGNPCNWCEMGTSFFMCLNEEQADVADYLGLDCETISTDTQQILKEHAALSETYEDSEDEEGAEEGNDEEEGSDVNDFDPSCILSMQNGPDKATCVATKDAEGTACEWCAFGSYNACLSDEQAEMVKPFGVTCDAEEEQSEADIQEAIHAKEEFWGCLGHTTKGSEVCSSTEGKVCTWCNTQAGLGVCLSYEAVAAVSETEFFDCLVAPEASAEEQPEAKIAQSGPQFDTSCLIDAGRFGNEGLCESAKDSISRKPCEWCQLGSLGVNACLSADQAELAQPLGVTCKGRDALPVVPEGAPAPAPLFQKLPKDFWPCFSQSNSVDECDEACTWCDVKGSTTGAGLCLSDHVADVVGYLSGDNVLDCTEPEEEAPAGESIAEEAVKESEPEAVDPSVA